MQCYKVSYMYQSSLINLWHLGKYYTSIPMIGFVCWLSYANHFISFSHFRLSYSLFIYKVCLIKLLKGVYVVLISMRVYYSLLFFSLLMCAFDKKSLRSMSLILHIASTSVIWKDDWSAIHSLLLFWVLLSRNQSCGQFSNTGNITSHYSMW